MEKNSKTWVYHHCEYFPGKNFTRIWYKRMEYGFSGGKFTDWRCIDVSGRIPEDQIEKEREFAI